MKSSLRSEPNSTARVRKNPCENPEVVSSPIHWLQERCIVLKHYIKDAEQSLQARNLGNDNLHLREEPSEAVILHREGCIATPAPCREIWVSNGRDWSLGLPW